MEYRINNQPVQYEEMMNQLNNRRFPNRLTIINHNTGHKSEITRRDENSYISHGWRIVNGQEIPLLGAPIFYSDGYIEHVLGLVPEQQNDHMNMNGGRRKGYRKSRKNMRKSSRKVSRKNMRKSRKVSRKH
jgi:hypothetical protein